MRSARAAAVVGVLLATAVTACTASNSSSAPRTTNPADSNAIISYNETEPANPLVPGNTTEVGGIGVLGALFRGLVEYDAKTAAPRNAVAESIRTSDSQHYTIKLKPGWTFHDGTPVTAHSFVEAWNYTAYSPNRMLGASYLSHIDGFDRVNNAAPDGSQPPTLPPAKQLSGLRVVDDRIFTVTLSAPFSPFPTQLGFAAFFPMPAAFFSDRRAYEAHPVGNGPFQFSSYTPGRDLLVSRYDRYAGSQRARIGGIDFRFYEDLDDAYRDVVANKLDYLSFTPWTVTLSGRYKTDLPASRRAAYSYLGYQAIAFPLYDRRWANPTLRQAISMAIDRTDLVKRVFNGARRPADGLVAPNVQGHLDNQCGNLCTYQPAKARQLFATTGFQGPIELTSNIDSGNQRWMQVTCESIQKALGRECRFLPAHTLGDLRRRLNAHSVHEIYRSAWVADYPSIENFLNPLFHTGGGANVGGYSNPAVDKLLAQADSAPSVQEGDRLYQQAERLILRDMPTVPIWWQSGTAAWSQRLHDVVPTQFRELDLVTVTVSAA